jgi:hypothetical protein
LSSATVRTSQFKIWLFQAAASGTYPAKLLDSDAAPHKETEKKKQYYCQDEKPIRLSKGNNFLSTFQLEKSPRNRGLHCLFFISICFT